MQAKACDAVSSENGKWRDFSEHRRVLAEGWSVPAIAESTV